MLLYTEDLLCLDFQPYTKTIILYYFSGVSRCRDFGNCTVHDGYGDTCLPCTGEATPIANWDAAGADM